MSYQRDMQNVVLGLREQVEELGVALAALLDHAERIQEHVPKSENWYAVRDTARRALRFAKEPNNAGA